MADYIKRMFFCTNSNTLVQFFRYTIVGGIAAFVDLSLYNTGVQILKANHIISNSFSFVSGLLVNYYLSREWVFNKKVHNIKKDFALFALVGVIGLLLSNIILFMLIDAGILYYLMPFSDDGRVKVTAKIAAVILVLFWNFTARKRIVFNMSQRSGFFEKSSYNGSRTGRPCSRLLFMQKRD